MKEDACRARAWAHYSTYYSTYFSWRDYSHQDSSASSSSSSSTTRGPSLVSDPSQRRDRAVVKTLVSNASNPEDQLVHQESFAPVVSLRKSAEFLDALGVNAMLIHGHLLGLGCRSGRKFRTVPVGGEVARRRPLLPVAVPNV